MKFNGSIQIIVTIGLLLITNLSWGQSNKKDSSSPNDSTQSKTAHSNQKEQIDLTDLTKKLFQMRHRAKPKALPSDSVFEVNPLSHPALQQSDNSKIRPGKLLFAAVPAVGYTIQTGVTAIIAMNLSFYSGPANTTNLSSIALNPAYSLDHHQFLLPVIFNVWTKDNKLNLVGDWRYYKYPTYTYGLGGHTTLSDADLVDYSYSRIYQEVLKQIASSYFYAGMGYNMDYHWNIKEEGTGTDFAAYNGNAKKTMSSGLSLNLIYDSRKNLNYPENAFYGNFAYRNNSTLLGSNQNWQSVQLEFKKHIKFPQNSDNVLAFWNLNWFTFGGKPPYFDLPSTGWDSYSNTGRGYIQGRLRGPGMLYLESEYRFRITQNGLLGGVIFGNAESVSELQSKRFETILPGAGFGIRIKLNKYSKANVAIDYGFGTEGSQGLFFNVSEVF